MSGSIPRKALYKLGEVCQLTDTQRALCPARHLLVNRFAFGELLGTDRQDVQIFSRHAIPHTDLQRLHPIQHIELGDAQSGDSVDLYRALESRGIEPAASPGTSRRGPDLLAARCDLAPDIIVQFRRKRP